MRAKKMRAKEGNLFKSSFFGAGVVVSAKHISSAPKGESSSTVELQIGGVAAPELVWWSRSPPKHALTLNPYRKSTPSPLFHYAPHLSVIMRCYPPVRRDASTHVSNLPLPPVSSSWDATVPSLLPGTPQSRLHGRPHWTPPRC
jgi:hypothetical protein